MSRTGRRMEQHLSLKREETRESSDDQESEVRLKTPPKRHREDDSRRHPVVQRSASESPTGGKYKPSPPAVYDGRETIRQIRRRQYFGAQCSDSEIVSPRPRSCESALKPEPPKQKKDSKPMRLRPLPKSFWEQPKSISNSSLAGSTYAVLPPLFAESNVADNLTDTRPVTPPNDDTLKISPRPKRFQTSPPDTELLFSLFDHLEKKIDPKLIVRRGRPKKDLSNKPPPAPNPKHEEDPYIVDAICSRLFPQLSLHGKQDPQTTTTTTQNSTKEDTTTTTISVIRVGEGKNMFEMPSINIEHNYEAMLSELVTHI